jgi:hypothetical protein
MHQKIHKVRTNGSSSFQYHTGRTITVSEVVRMLTESSRSNRHTCVRRGSKLLLDKMAEKQWRISAGAHRGGFGGKNKAPDQTTHITMNVGGSSYHLRLDAKGHLFMITGPGIENTVMPWVAPGSR